MNSRQLLVAATVLVVVTAWCNQARGDKKMDGTWIPVAAELAGQEFPRETLKTMKLVLAGDKYTVLVGDIADKGTAKTDVTKKPHTLDITGTEGPNKGKTFLAIYELDGETLRVCYDLTGQARPTEFKTKKGTQLFLATYKRGGP